MNDGNWGEQRGEARSMEGRLALGGFLERGFRPETATDRCQSRILLKGGWLWGQEEV